MAYRNYSQAAITMPPPPPDSSRQATPDQQAGTQLQQPLTVPFTGTDIDRASELREDRHELQQLLAHPHAAVLGASADSVLVTDGAKPHLLRRPVGGHVNPHQPILLGIDGGSPLFAADLDDPEAQSHSKDTGVGRLVTLREAGLLLPQAEAGLAAYLVALLGWHRNHHFCAGCGAPTKTTHGGLSRRCPRCSRNHFPRTDPVVIMLVDDGEGNLLLGRRIGWAEGRFSILAGYVAPGETPEEAVLREVAEESGVRAHSPRYITSQPWPFPSSLMLGYEASADREATYTRDDGRSNSPAGPVPQPGEMVEVGWFSLEQVLEASRDEERQSVSSSSATALRLPGEVSIARRLIDAWAERGGRRLAP